MTFSESCRKLNEEGKCAGDCCGIVPIPTDVWNKSQDKIQKLVIKNHITEVFVMPFTEDNKCCFLTRDNKCAIYNSRPTICQEYSQSERLPCPHLKPNGHEWSEAKAKQIWKKINRDVDTAIEISNQQAKRFGCDKID
jgi:Fe-S-cluster containining protein